MKCGRDVLSTIMRSEPASQARFERLRNVEALVCWEWRFVARAMRIDSSWLAAFVAEAERYRLKVVPSLKEDRDYVALIQQGLQEYRSHATAVVATLGALRLLLMGGYTIDKKAVPARKLVKRGVLEIIAETMRACYAVPVFDAEERLAVACIEFLEYMFNVIQRKDRRRARDSGVCEAVACIVQRHPVCPRFQGLAFEMLVLGNKKLGVATGATAVIAALQFHSPQTSRTMALWRTGLILLCEISGTRDVPTEITDVQVEILVAGGIDVLMHVLRMPRPCPEATPFQLERFFVNQYRVCMILGHLAGGLYADVTQEIVDADGIALIVAAMLGTPAGNNECCIARDVHAAGCFALGYIGWVDTALQQRIVDAGGLPAVKAATRITAHPMCTEHGERLLRRLRALR